MIISVHGTEYGKRSSAPILSLLASLTMLQRNKKTLILPLCRCENGMDLEMLMDAKTKLDNEAASVDGIYEFNDNGIDAFFRQTSAGRLTATHFEDYTVALAKIKHYLDITPPSSQPDFEDMLGGIEEDVQLLFKAANEVYNYTFVLVNSSNEPVTHMVDKMADRIIITVRQGKTESLTWDLYDDDQELRKKTFFLVEDYEKESGFDIGALKKGYRTKKLYTLPHNVQFRDAVESGSILQYALKNAKAVQGDYNYELSDAVRRLMDAISGKTAMQEDEEQLESELTAKEKKADATVNKEEILARNVGIEEVTKKRFFTRKIYKKPVLREHEPSSDGKEFIFVEGSDDLDRKPTSQGKERKPRKKFSFFKHKDNDEKARKKKEKNTENEKNKECSILTTDLANKESQVEIKTEDVKGKSEGEESTLGASLKQDPVLTPVSSWSDPSAMEGEMTPDKLEEKTNDGIEEQEEPKASKKTGRTSTRKTASNTTAKKTTTKTTKKVISKSTAKKTPKKDTGSTTVKNKTAKKTSEDINTVTNTEEIDNKNQLDSIVDASSNTKPAEVKKKPGRKKKEPESGESGAAGNEALGAAEAKKRGRKKAQDSSEETIQKSGKTKDTALEEQGN